MKWPTIPILWILLLVICLCDDQVRASTSSARSNYQALEVVGKDPIELIELRGFKAERHFARTKDGYYIYLARIVNPRKNSTAQLKRPVIFNHGLMESPTLWLEYAKDVQALPYNGECGKIADSKNGTIYRNAAMMLANHGYDVWLMSMRGTDFSLHHDRLTPLDAAFWDYSLDDFGLSDLPAVIRYVRATTGASKVGYIGHSQATFAVFALLATQPDYADIIEPVVAVAPVSYFHHIYAIVRPVFLGSLLTKNNGPFPPAAKVLRKTLVDVCSAPLWPVPNPVCQLFEMLGLGAGRTWLKGFFSHFPYTSSLKVMRHFGTLIKNKQFQRYDYGREKNLLAYGQPEAPAYPIENIRSMSLCLVSTRTDALSAVQDVELFRERLTVPLYKDIFIDKKFNHEDMILNELATVLVNQPILEIFESFECGETDDVDCTASES